MRTICCGLATSLALLGCAKPDPANDPHVQAAIVAGGVTLSTINKCLLHMEQAGNTAVPECDAAKEAGEYESARQRVKAADLPTLQPVNDQIERARAEAVSAVVRIALQAAR